MAASVKDVARHAGVSVSTVSYVLSGNRPISEKTRQRVLASIEDSGFQPHAGARSIRAGATDVFASGHADRAGRPGRRSDAVRARRPTSGTRQGEESAAPAGGGRCRGTDTAHRRLGRRRRSRDGGSGPRSTGVGTVRLEQASRPDRHAGGPTALGPRRLRLRSRGRGCARNTWPISVIDRSHTSASRTRRSSGRPATPLVPATAPCRTLRRPKHPVRSAVDRARTGSPAEALERLFQIQPRTDRPDRLQRAGPCAPAEAARRARDPGSRRHVVVAICPEEQALDAHPPVSNVSLPAAELGTVAVDQLARAARRRQPGAGPSAAGTDAARQCKSARPTRFGVSGSISCTSHCGNPVMNWRHRAGSRSSGND